MQRNVLENVIMTKLYAALFTSQDQVSLREIREQEGIPEVEFSKTVDRLVEARLIRARTAGENYACTSRGAIYAEEHGLADPELIAARRHIRTILLDTLAQTYDTGGKRAYSTFDSLTSATSTDELTFVRHLMILEDHGYAEVPGSRMVIITPAGRGAVHKWRAQKTLVEEFAAIETMAPHPRGRAVQKFIAKIVEASNWSQQEGLRTSNEEIDIVIHRGQQYFLIECKWEKDPIETEVVTTLYGKVSNRSGVQGIIFSMSGFSKGAIKQAHDYANNRIILLFGPNDTRSIVNGETTFEALLDQKYDLLVTVRDVKVS